MEDSLEIDLTGLVIPERIEITRESDDESRGEFVIEPLERGFGHTLGNSVRRVLLASLRGSAVWAFRINGVVHEHETIKGVVEDVHQVIQNFKSLVVSLDDDLDQAVLKIELNEPGAVTASQIVDKPGVTIHNPEHHLMTLQNKRNLSIELYVQKGRGFVLAEQHEFPEEEKLVDLVRIDSIYNPVRLANFSVEETRVGQRTDFDRLTLSVKTNGSVSAETAVSYAVALLQKHLEFMLYFGEGGLPQTETLGSKVSEEMRDLLRRPLEDITELSVRSRNSLKKEGVSVLADLVQRSEDQMLSIGNFGKKSLTEIADFLSSHGLEFGMQLLVDEEGEFTLIEESEETEPEDSFLKRF
ncbi:MAG TPA: DNA-directed RNA polymerase subunit alpha [Gemmatimonadetes bacterium]|nr:DNA-directed RNA polymerase subunit alpha [Gemmatimonadota bacterium]